MREAREAVYLPPRRKQACSRCHTKRIKCLGGVPCRNCALSSSLCVFPPTTKSKPGGAQLQPIFPAPSTQNRAPSTISPSSPGNYRRAEKDFTSSRSSNDARGARPTYRGNPSCQNFAEQFTTWVAYRRDELFRETDHFFDPAWGPLTLSLQDVTEPSLEISIDTTAQGPVGRPKGAKPVTIRLPPYNHSIQLIQVLESAIGHEQHYFRRRELRAKVARMHQNPESAQSKDQGWLCHWLAVVALGELYNGTSGLSGGLEPPGADYYHQSVSLLPQVAESPDIQYIETLGLLALYAFCMNRPNTAYMYVGVSLRAALSLNLHRDPAEFPSERSNLSAVELEHEKRVFWTVYYQDLLTTTTTGRPWGVLDDEITVGYASSANLTGEAMFEFSDADEVNAHLELMRLRSQAYSSLYGYAGTAINPHSHISLFDFELGANLSTQHLDKITEFYEGLLAWESELTPSLTIQRNWDGSMNNLNRVTGNLYLLYHQSILVILRPALVNAFNDSFDVLVQRTKSFGIAPFDRPLIESPRLDTLWNFSLASAKQIAVILQWLYDQGALSTYSFFDASYAFTAAITLCIARTMASHVDLLPRFTSEDQLALDRVLRLLRNQAEAKNAAAVEFTRLLGILQNNLQALEASLHDGLVGAGP